MEWYTPENEPEERPILPYAAPPERTPVRLREMLDLTLDLLGGPLPILLILGLYCLIFGSRFHNGLGAVMIIGGALLVQAIIIIWRIADREPTMGLFKSKDERRVEREMKIRMGIRAIEKSIRQQEKFSEDFIKNAQHARKIGDEQQYQFVRGALRRTASVKRMLERQLLTIKNAMLIQQQAQASQQFAESMQLMANEIGRVFGELDLTKTQADWERAVAKAGSIEERMELFLDSMETSGSAAPVSAGAEVVSDEEIDRMIQADVLAQEKAELGKLDQLESEIAKELGSARQKD